MQSYYHMDIKEEVFLLYTVSWYFTKSPSQTGNTRTPPVFNKVKQLKEVCCSSTGRQTPQLPHIGSSGWESTPCLKKTPPAAMEMWARELCIV